MRNITKTLSLAFICLSTANVAGQEVPVDLPNQAAVDAYLNYLERPGYSAFAVSQLGTFGESWSYGLIAAAEDAAIEDCLSKQPKGYCYIVSVDGVSTRDTIPIPELIARIEASKQIEWQPVTFNEVPVQIANNAEQIASYQQYTQAHGYKAYAATHTGAWGASSEQSTNDLAVYYALQACQQQDNGSDNCQVIDQNNQAVLGRIALAHLKQQEQVTEQDPGFELPALEASTPRDKELARPLFGDRWQDYQDAERNKAFAINKLGAIGLAKEHVTSLVAEEAALGACEHFQSFRHRYAQASKEDKQCFIVAVNNFYDPDIINKMLNTE